VAQFDIYLNPNAAQRNRFPFVVQVQNDFFDEIPTRLVVPLQRTQVSFSVFPRRLSQPFRFEGEPLFIAAHLAAAVPASLLRKPVAAAAEQEGLIRDAMDAVISGV
jgi:toxin CcdB